jgi:TATA-box binding protein (TBP) (component of TFIID and TFIIIB)
MVITGAKSEQLSKQAAQLYAKTIEKSVGEKVSLTGFEV